MSSSHYILCLETSTSCCSVAVANETGCIGLLECHLLNSHARLLPHLCDSLLQALSLDRESLSAVALSQGPGSFTGLRIGAATTKGLCYGLQIPLISAPTLPLLVESMGLPLPDRSYFLALLPQKGQTFAYALYNSSLEQIIAPQMGPLSSATLQLHSTDPVYVLSPMPQALELLRNLLPSSTKLIHLSLSPSARQMCRYAFAAYLRQDFTSPEDFEPLYASRSTYTQIKPR